MVSLQQVGLRYPPDTTITPDPVRAPVVFYDDQHRHRRGHDLHDLDHLGLEQHYQDENQQQIPVPLFYIRHLASMLVDLLGCKDMVETCKPTQWCS